MGHGCLSQCSAIVAAPMPTSQTSFEVRAMAEYRSVVGNPGWLGVATTDHEWPSQCSAIGKWLRWFEPTAHTSFEATAVTPNSIALANGVGAWTIDHDVPFQCSVRTSGSTWGTWLRPTAQTSFGATAATPRNWVCAPETVGVGTTCHAVPSKCSASGR